MLKFFQEFPPNTYKESEFLKFMEKKHRTFWGVVGIILIVLGAIYTIPLAIKGGIYSYGLFITGAAVVSGILLIAWTFGD